MPVPVFFGRVDQTGTLRLDQRAALLAYVRTLAGQRVEVIVRPPRRQRSGQQNRYYWSVVVQMFADELGYTPDEAHEALKQQFLKVEDKGPLPTLRSTADLTTAEFEHYLENCRMLATSLCGFIIPLPHEVLA